MHVCIAIRTVDMNIQQVKRSLILLALVHMAMNLCKSFNMCVIVLLHTNLQLFTF